MPMVADPEPEKPPKPPTIRSVTRGTSSPHPRCQRTPLWLTAATQVLNDANQAPEPPNNCGKTPIQKRGRRNQRWRRSKAHRNRIWPRAPNDAVEEGRRRTTGEGEGGADAKNESEP